jgi:predicted Zn-dependent peptidase
MVQSSVTLISKNQKFNPKIMPYIYMFNEFYGAGMASIVFQELRESKGLVYSAYAYINMPNDKNKSHYLMASLNTQPDKMKDALAAMFGILNKMPDAKAQFEASRKAALIKIESKRLTKSDPFWIYKWYQKLGIDYDINEMIYNKIQTMTYEDFQAFFKKNIAEKKFNIVVIGNEKDIDFETLKNYGELIKLDLDDLFPY